MNFVSLKAVPVWRISSAITLGILWLSGALTWQLTAGFGRLNIYTEAGITLGLAGLVVLFVTFIPPLRWHRWRYKIHEDFIEIQHGLYFIERTLVPTRKVQHVSTQRGPIQRWFQVSTISVHTAATTHEIPILEDHDAISLRDRIAELAKLGDEDV